MTKAKTKFKIVINVSADGVGVDIETYVKDVKPLTILGAIDLARSNFIETHFTNQEVKTKQS